MLSNGLENIRNSLILDMLDFKCCPQAVGNICMRPQRIESLKWRLGSYKQEVMAGTKK